MKNIGEPTHLLPKIVIHGKPYIILYILHGSPASILTFIFFLLNVSFMIQNYFMNPWDVVIKSVEHRSKFEFTSCTLSSWASRGVSVVSILEIIDRNVTGSHCSMNGYYMQSSFARLIFSTFTRRVTDCDNDGKSCSPGVAF